MVHDYAFSFGQPDVVAGFLLHLRQDDLFIMLKVNDDGAWRLNGVFSGLETCLMQAVGLWFGPGEIGFDLEREGSLSPAEIVEFR